MILDESAHGEVGFRPAKFSRVIEEQGCIYSNSADINRSPSEH